MEGSSHGAWLAALAKARDVESVPGVDVRAVAGELFLVSQLLADQAKLRRAMADPARDAWPKQDLVRRVFGGRLSQQAMDVVLTAVAGRWTRDHDLTDALERLGMDLVFAAAEHEGRLNKLEDELFAITELVTKNQPVHNALGRRDVGPGAKVELVRRLLTNKVSADALWLATRPALNPRGRRYTATLWRMLAIADERRRLVTAVITSAIPLTPEQKHRIEAALSQTYGRAVNANLVVDPAVLGGVHIRVGDDVIDGSVARRLDDASRAVVSG